MVTFILALIGPPIYTLPKMLSCSSGPSICIAVLQRQYFLLSIAVPRFYRDLQSAWSSSPSPLNASSGFPYQYSSSPAGPLPSRSTFITSLTVEGCDPCVSPLYQLLSPGLLSSIGFSFCPAAILLFASFVLSSYSCSYFWSLLACSCLPRSAFFWISASFGRGFAFCFLMLRRSK
jgi:hypothetical protein